MIRTSIILIKHLLIIFFIIPSFVFAQSVKQDSIWKPMKFFVGNWHGSGEGEPGKGNYERTYQFTLGKNFIEIRNKSTYQPTSQNPKGEIHEDIGYMSYDKTRRVFVLRQFHIEGFVNQYRLQSISPDGKTIIFISETIENIGLGWRAKETYEIKTEDEFIETFALAPSNDDFSLYTKTTFKRVLKTQ